MKYSEAQKGRTFVIRLEDGEILHEVIEKFAKIHSVNAASVIIVGGVDKGSQLIVGPEDGRSKTINAKKTELENVYEACGTGTIFPDDNGNPILHMHIACGRGTDTITGCVRSGVKVWHILEVIIEEIINTKAQRIPDKNLGFKLLEP